MDLPKKMKVWNGTNESCAEERTVVMTVNGRYLVKAGFEQNVYLTFGNAKEIRNDVEVLRSSNTSGT